MKKNLGLLLMVASVVTVFAAGEPASFLQFACILTLSYLLGTMGYFLWKGAVYPHTPEYTDPETGEVYYGLSARQLFVELIERAWGKVRVAVLLIVTGSSMILLFWQVFA